MMETVGLVPSATGKPGGKKTGERVSDYVLYGGPFYHAALALIESGFKLGWIDRLPVRNFSPTPDIYDEQGAPVLSDGDSAIDAPDRSGSKDRESVSGFTQVVGSGLLTGTSAELGCSDHSEAGSEFLPIQPTVSQPTRTRYTCRCDNKVWGKPKLNIRCEDCSQRYEASA